MKKIKKVLLRIFSTWDLFLEIQKREWRFPPEESGKDWDNLLKRINQQFPEFVNLLKLREYNLAQSLLLSEEKDRERISARMAEVKYWQIKILNVRETAFNADLKEAEIKEATKELEKRGSGLKKFAEKFLTKEK